MLDEIVTEALAERGGVWIGKLASQFGFTAAQAEGLVPAALERIAALLQNGTLDVSSGLDAGSVLSNLNVGELAGKVGIEADKAAEGLEGVLPEVVSTIQEKAGGAEGLLSMLGGGGIGGAAGKLRSLF